MKWFDIFIVDSWNDLAFSLCYCSTVLSFTSSLYSFFFFFFCGLVFLLLSISPGKGMGVKGEWSIAYPDILLLFFRVFYIFHLLFIFVLSLSTFGPFFYFLFFFVFLLSSYSLISKHRTLVVESYHLFPLLQPLQYFQFSFVLFPRPFILSC